MTFIPVDTKSNWLNKDERCKHWNFSVQPYEMRGASETYISHFKARCSDCDATASVDAWTKSPLEAAEKLFALTD